MSMPPEHDLTGQQFEDWTVLRYVGWRRRATMWLCRCKCGREGEVSAGNLRSGHSARCRACAARSLERKIVHRRQTRTLAEWAQHLGLSLGGLYQRLRKYPVAVALRKKLPKPKNRPQGHPLTFNGETMNETQWAKRLGCSKQALHSRLKKMSVEQALAMPVAEKRKLAGRKAALWRTRRGKQSTRTTPGEEQ